MKEPRREAPSRTAHAWAAAAVPAEVYDEIASALTNPDSPVGIDARHTHVLILHALDRIERRLEAAGLPARAPTAGAATGVEDASALSARAHALLARSPAAAALDPGLRRRLEAAIAATVTMAAGDDATALPGFVADLIDGVFEAIVNASIQQMQAYADLLEGVAEGVDRFGVDRKGPVPQRQRLLATMVLMGVNRLVVTRGRVRVRSVFDEDQDDDD